MSTGQFNNNSMISSKIKKIKEKILSYGRLSNFPIQDRFELINNKGLIHLKIIDTRVIDHLYSGIADQIDILDMSGHNLIPEYSEKIANLFNHVVQLRFGFSELEQIENGYFEQFQNMVYLDLQANHFGRFENSPELDPDMFLGLQNLQVLNISKNFNEVPKNIFLHLSHLRKLIWNHADLSDIHQDFFIHLKNLKDLRLYNNNISEIGEYTFTPLTRLEKINLVSNSIKMVHENAFNRCVNLKSIDLSYNKLNKRPVLLNCDAYVSV